MLATAAATQQQQARLRSRAQNGAHQGREERVVILGFNVTEQLIQNRLFDSI